MSFQQSIVVDLQDEKLVQFVIEHSVGQETEIIPEFQNGFFVARKRKAGTSNQKVYWTVLEEWAICYDHKNPKTLGTKEVRCFASKSVAVDLNTNLLVSSSIDAGTQKAIVDAFLAFDETAHGDPQDYIAEQLRNHPEVTRKMFQVALGYTVRVAGNEVLDTRERDIFIDSFKGPGSIVTDPSGKRENRSEYIKKHDIFPRPLGSQIFPGIMPALPDPDKIETTDPQATAEERARKEAPECSHTKTEVHDVADLLHWIEIKVIWSEARVDLGCGNYFTFKYPEFRSREVSYILCSALTAPDPVDQHVKQAVMDCFWMSALSAAVVGVAMANPKAALIAFKALFSSCVIAKFKAMIDCVNVDLFIQVRVVKDWH